MIVDKIRRKPYNTYIITYMKLLLVLLYIVIPMIALQAAITFGKHDRPRRKNGTFLPNSVETYKPHRVSIREFGREVDHFYI